jgi:hypothetical protein
MGRWYLVEGYTRVPDDGELDAFHEDLARSLIAEEPGWFVEPICQLSPVRMVQACRALAVAMGC